MIPFVLLLAHFSARQAPQVPHEVNIWVARNVAPSAKIRLNINTRNVPVVHFDALPVDGLTYFRTGIRKPNYLPPPIGPSVIGWDVSVADRKNREAGNDHYYSQQVNLPLLRPGVYLLVVRGEGNEARAVVNVTNLAVVMKRSSHKTLAWVTDFRSGRVVEGAEVEVRGPEVQRSKTDAQGIALFPGNVKNADVIVQNGKDLAWVATGAHSPDGRLRALFQTDRPIYRPGQTVSYKAILRTVDGRGYRPVTGQEAVVTVRDPRDNPLDEIRLRPNAMGSVAGTFRIPQEGMTGPYSIVLQVANQSAYQTFSVAAYRKPEYKVEAQPVQRRYLSGETIHYKVNAAYYFGAPVPQARVRWTVRRNGLSFFTPSDEERWFYGGDGNLYPSDTYSSTPFVGEGETVTDNEGNATIEVKSDPNAPDSTYQLDVTVEDASRRQVQGSASVPVYAAALRLGVTSPQWVTALGGLIPVELRAADLDGRPVGAKVTLRLFEPYWVEKEGRYRERLLAERTVQVPPTGKLLTNMPAKAEGNLPLRVEAPDGTGRKAKAAMDVYVAGPDYKPERETPEPMLNVKLDKRIYEPGQSATAYVTTNRPKRPILAVLEGRDIFGYSVMAPGKGARTWRFVTSVEESPNAYVSVTQWAEHGSLSANAILPVPDRTRQITVQAIPQAKELRPGDKTHVTVRTTDSQGRPVAAEVALSVVDEAIYAISPDTTPDPYGFYWGLRQNDVTSVLSAPEEVSGGAYQRANAMAPVRQRFEDTAYWNAFVTTGSNGVGVAEFEVPGNLTTWRATARGVTSSTQVGMGRGSFVATRPVTFRLATPRMVAEGDEFTLIGTVNNRSAEPVSEEVVLTPTGIEASDLTQRVDVPSHSERTVRWKLHAVKAPASGFFTLLARANGRDADHSDALQVSVPMVPRGVRETTQSAGTLTNSATVNLSVPPDALPQGATLSVRVFAGILPVAQDAAGRVFRGGRYGSPAAADVLLAAAATGLAGHEDDVREALALLSRTQHPDGWGWWDDAPSDPVITARVGHALAMARSAGNRVFDSMWNSARSGARMQYDRTNLWEHRALLAATMVELEADRSMDSLREVRERGLHLSPYSRLRMAEALVNHDRGWASEIVDAILALVSDGPSSAFVPIGEGIGWTASEADTTAQLLTVLCKMDIHADMQRKLANRLAVRNRWYRSMDEDAATATALSWYAKRHEVATEAGTASVVLGDKRVELAQSTVEASASVDLPLESLPTVPVRLERKGSGEAFYTVNLRYYRNVLVENATGVRVSRRYEVKNEAGAWSEVDRPVKPGEPVRCTVVVWGDDRSDAVRVTEPIPTGFEFVESENAMYGAEDVRDGAVVHYLLNSGAPVYFRYYLRAEADGRLIALPAVAEYLRRPAQRGQSSALELVVHP